MDINWALEEEHEDGTKTLVISDCNIDVDIDLPPCVKSLYLENSSFKTLRSEGLEFLSIKGSYEFASIEANNIKYLAIHPYILLEFNLESIEHLELLFNKFIKLPDSALKLMKNLKTVTTDRKDKTCYPRHVKVTYR